MKQTFFHCDKCGARQCSVIVDGELPENRKKIPCILSYPEADFGPAIDIDAVMRLKKALDSGAFARAFEEATTPDYQEGK